MLNSYDYYPVGGGIAFHFTTKRNITYSLSLANYSSMFGIPDGGCRLLFIYLTPVAPFAAPVPLDMRVKDTVVRILTDYLEASPDVIFYVCSNADGRERKRRASFERWYHQHRTGDIMQQSRKVDGELSYFLYKKGNALASAIFELLDA